jgi:SAM-dependent methyltransferase
MGQSSSAAYAQQDRGDADDYARYLSSMDASMRQKVALTAAHLLCQGRVADMGMGSGTGSQALAALYPSLEVVGVDVNPTMVALARERYRLPNLRFEEGDIARPVFPEESLDGVLDSSVLHHVTSFNGYERTRAGAALGAQVRQLKLGGVLIVRDFLDPGPGEVLLEVPADDGTDSDDPRSCSTAQLLERFAREFRSLHARPGFSLARVDAAEVPAGWRRYRLSRTLAAEFVLRKDYRGDWESEAQEEYTYLTQDGFEAEFARLGLRVLASTPLWNPWIVRNRFEGRFTLRSLEGAVLAPPATNYVIVGEKVPAGEGVRFRPSEAVAPLGFLALEHYRNARTGQVMDLVRRPNLTLDVLPFFESRGEVFVLARMSYPRPVLCAGDARGASDGSRTAGYVTEPLNVLQTDKPLGTTIEEMLEADARIAPEALRRFLPGTEYYPSPGGIQEQVRSTYVEISPVLVQDHVANRSGFSTSGRVRAIEAQQVLRAAQVGGLPDARLELNVYDLMLKLGQDVGPWIGEEIAPLPISAPVPPSSLEAIGRRAPRRTFARARAEESTRFLALHCREFEELDASGKIVARRPLEYVVPRPLTATTVAAALLMRVGAQVLLGVDDDDLPAAQCFTGESQLLVTPAWRLPSRCADLPAAKSWVREQIAKEYGIRTGELWTLGGSYFPSAGATPEVVHPWAIEVRAVTPALRALHWIPLDELVEGRAELHDGHLRILSVRAAHALGLLS